MRSLLYGVAAFALLAVAVLAPPTLHDGDSGGIAATIGSIVPPPPTSVAVPERTAGSLDRVEQFHVEDLVVAPATAVTVGEEVGALRRPGWRSMQIAMFRVEEDLGVTSSTTSQRSLPRLDLRSRG